MGADGGAGRARRPGRAFPVASTGQSRDRPVFGASLSLNTRCWILPAPQRVIHAARQFCAGRCRAYTSVVECYCCGLDRDSAMVTALQCHNEVNLCRICIGWLMRRAGVVDVTPTYR